MSVWNAYPFTTLDSLRCESPSADNYVESGARETMEARVLSGSVWFQRGRAAGERHARGEASSREQSWLAATQASRGTLRRWQQFNDGWVAGFLQPQTTAADAGASAAPGVSPRCSAVLADGRPCARTAVVLLPPAGGVYCASHAHAQLRRLPGFRSSVSADAAARYPGRVLAMPLRQARTSRARPASRLLGVRRPAAEAIAGAGDGMDIDRIGRIGL